MFVLAWVSPSSAGSVLHQTKGDHTGTARILLDHGADLNVKDHFGIIALIYAVTNNRTETTQFLQERAKGQSTINK